MKLSAAAKFQPSSHLVMGIERNESARFDNLDRTSRGINWPAENPPANRILRMVA